MQFEFATVARIVFGRGKIQLLPEIVREFGSAALVVTGSKPDRAAKLIDALQRAGVETFLFICAGEPTVDLVRSGAAVAREKQAALVVGIGGGSAMDAAKAIAIIATNSGEPLDYLEVVGKGQPFERMPLPFVAVPTTAGTGAEVTRNAVLGSPAHGVKASLRSSSMLAKVALVDPELTAGLPREVTAYTGMDALTQLIEPFVSCRANPMVDLFCVEGLKRVRNSLLRAFEDGQDLEARESMSYASLLGGLSLSNAGLGVVHGFAAPLGGLLDAPHGALCAAILPWGVSVNLKALRDRGPSHPALGKFGEATRILLDDRKAAAEDLPRWLADLVRRLGIRRLSERGLTQDRIPDLVAKAAQASSMKANPIPLTEGELRQVIELSF